MLVSLILSDTFINMTIIRIDAWFKLSKIDLENIVGVGDTCCDKNFRNRIDNVFVLIFRQNCLHWD